MREVIRSKDITFDDVLDEVVTVYAVDYTPDKLDLVSLDYQQSYVRVGKILVQPYVASVNGLDIDLRTYAFDKFDPNGAESGSTINFMQVNWGDNTSDTFNAFTASALHTYPNAGNYEIEIIWGVGNTGGSTRTQVTVV